MSETRVSSKYRLHILLGVVFVLAGLLAFQPSADQGVALESKRVHQPTQTSIIVLPETLTRPVLPPAMDDPFAAAAPVPVLEAKRIEVTPPPPSPAPPPVAVPPLNLQFIGRVTHSSGKELIYMAYGDSTLILTEGQSLPNGYKVDAVTQKQVRFNHPQLENPVILELPAPPTFQTR